MQQQLELLVGNLTLIDHFEKLFASADPQTFTAKLGKKETPNSFCNAIDGRNASLIFDGFKFPTGDKRSDAVNEAIAILKEILPTNTQGIAELDNVDSSTRVFNFFNLTIGLIVKPPAQNGSAVAEEIIQSALAVMAGINLATQKQVKMATLLRHIRTLISLQKKHIISEIDRITPLLRAEAETVNQLKQQQETQTRHSAARKKALTYTGEGALFGAGLGLATLSGLMQFNPHIIMQIATHLPPATLAIFAGLHVTPMILAMMAAAGIGMAGTAAYLAYRTYTATPVVVQATNTSTLSSPDTHVAPDVANSRFAPYITPTLLVSGLSMMISSAALQFGPQVALLAALQAYPAALVAIAAVGTLLVSIALYRLCKTYLQNRAEAAAPSTTHDAENAAPAQASCYQRIMSHVPHCCFNLFKRAEQQKSADVTPSSNMSNPGRV